MKLKAYLPEILILLLGLSVRLINLNGSFWLDEAAQVLESRRPLSQQFAIAADFQPPLFHLITHFLVQLNQSEAWLRLASLIPGMISLYLTMLLGKKLFNRDVGLTAGILLATSQFHLFYSQELRPYSLATMLALLAFWYWLKLVNHASRFSWGFFLSSLAGLYTSYLFPVFLLSLLIITFIFYRPKALFLGICFLVLMIGFIPWLPSFFEQLNIGTSFASAQPAWSTIVSPPLVKMLPLVYLKFVFGRIPVDPDPLTLLITGLTAISFLAAAARIKRQVSGRLVISLALLPILIAFIISIFVPVLDPKRVLFCLPFAYLTLAAGLGKRLNSALILMIFLTVNLFAIRLYATNPETQREPWRQAISILEADAPADTLVIFAFDAPFAPWDWYQTRNLPTLAITHPAAMPPITHQHVVFFEYLKPIYDPGDQIVANLVDQGYGETGFYQYPGLGKMRVYAR